MLSRTLLASASALLVSFLASPVSAQLHTDCNPTLKDCPADPAFGTAHTFYFNSTPATGLWNNTAGTVTYDATTGAAFTIAEKGYSPTLTTNFYFFWGRTEVIMKAANGTGIISSIVWGSDDLDEVDWEFKGGDTANAQSNYYGKGVTNSSSGGTHPVTGNVQTEWHNYTNVWTNTSLQWWIDGTLVRTLTPAAANDSRNYPQTPMKLSLGIWAGGDSSQAAGTIEWAGGATDYSAGPYTMYVKSAYIEDFSSGTEYSYGDRTGSSSSIKITNAGANSTAVDNLNASTEVSSDQSISEKWNALPSSTKTGIYAGASGLVAVMFIALLFYYFKQRRRGQQEAALAAKHQEQERLELEEYKKNGVNPDALAFEGADYDPSSMRKDGMVSTTAYSVPNDSRSNSLQSMHAMPEKTSTWDPTSAGMASPGMRSPMPLLDTGVQSARVGSPAPQGGYSTPNRNNSFSPVSPVGTQSPGMSGNPSVRMGSPGPQVGGYGGYGRIESPAPMQSPPNRSYSSPRNQGGYSGGGPDGYFNGNGYR